MKIKLLKDKLEGGKVKVNHPHGRKPGFFWSTGQIIDVSDATGKDMVKAGEAEIVLESATVAEES